MLCYQYLHLIKYFAIVPGLLQFNISVQADLFKIDN